MTRGQVSGKYTRQVSKPATVMARGDIHARLPCNFVVRVDKTVLGI